MFWNSQLFERSKNQKYNAKRQKKKGKNKGALHRTYAVVLAQVWASWTHSVRASPFPHGHDYTSLIARQPSDSLKSRNHMVWPSGRRWEHPHEGDSQMARSRWLSDHNLIFLYFLFSCFFSFYISYITIIYITKNTLHTTLENC